MCNNPNLDHVDINAHEKLAKFYKVVLMILSENEIMTDGRNDGRDDRMTE